ncbi:T9SS type A sorting domain-containing protein [Kordia sp.]|uniref:T9SS type A sorting domain-containing protein n=1 Tax=Kordia sp. TaxID=1965332 RepID=UPI003D2C0A89
MKTRLLYTIFIFLTYTTIGFSQVDLGDDITTCDGQEILLDATTQNATSYQWTVNGQILVNETNATLVVLQSGVYEATAIIIGVPSSDTVTVSFNPSPVVGNITNLLAQGASGGDIGVFNLTTKIPEITNGNTNLDVTFYESLSDAEADTNPIVNPTNYQNTVNPQILFVRVQDISTGCFSIGSFALEVSTHTVVSCNTNPGITTYCYGNNDSTQFVIRSADDISTVSVEFLAGEVENSWDELIVYDTGGTVVYTGYGNNGDLTGLIFESTGNEITIQITSDGYMSCVTDSLEPWVFTASCTDTSSVGIINTQSFLDENNNSVFDDGEILFPFGNISYELNDSGEINVGSTNGTYFIISDDANNSYDLTFSLFEGYEDCYDVTTPTVDDATVAIGESLVLYFPITVAQPCEDLEVVLINSFAPPRPGFTHNNYLYLNNVSTSTIATGTIEVVIDDLLVFNGVISINPNYIVTNTATGFTVDFVNFAPLSTELIEIELLCPASVALGEVVTNTATYTTDTNDLITENNSSSLSEVVVGSWDPNDITESHGPEIVHENFTSQDYLYYTIRFQNLGTAEAVNVRIEETLDTELDETTFEMITASHNFQVQRVNDELVWNFDNINLPAEMFDAEGSNGFVYFKIKPKAGYAIDDMIPGVAGIYFDFNAPVITNTFETTFIAPLSVDEIATTNIAIYPNPAKDILYVSSEILEKITIQLYDLQGKQILQKVAENTKIPLNISTVKSGIYFLKITTATKQFIKKIIVD